MAGAKGKRSKLLTITIGCFSVLLLIIGVSGVVAVWAGLSYRSLGSPSSGDATRAIAVGDSPARQTATPPPGTDLAQLSPTEFPGAARNATPIKLDITLAEGSFEILPGEPGSDITVDGKYATNYYELLDERQESEGGREISLHLKPTAGMFTRMIAGLTNINDHHPNRLTIYIPPDVPIDLNILLEAGESRVELGGLNLTDLDVNFSKGDFRLSFDEPLAAPLPRMALSMQMGDGRMNGLGNARAGEIVVDTGMGGFRVSLDGEWDPSSESRINIDHMMGDLNLIVPTDVRIGEDSSNVVIFGGADGRLKNDKANPPAEDAATLHLDVSTSMGSVNVRRSGSSSSSGG